MGNLEIMKDFHMQGQSRPIAQLIFTQMVDYILERYVQYSGGEIILY